MTARITMAILFSVMMLGVIGIAYAVDIPVEDGIESTVMFSVTNLNFTNNNYLAGTNFNLKSNFSNLGILYSEILSNNDFEIMLIYPYTDLQYTGTVVDGIIDGYTFQVTALMWNDDDPQLAPIEVIILGERNYHETIITSPGNSPLRITVNSADESISIRLIQNSTQLSSVCSTP